MIASPEKLVDIKERDECLELMAFCLKKGLIEQGMEFGKLSKFYAERIKKDEYAGRDKKWEIYHKLQTI